LSPGRDAPFFWPRTRGHPSFHHPVRRDAPDVFNLERAAPSTAVALLSTEVFPGAASSPRSRRTRRRRHV
jgi:hypothetical protein